jgi:hypothetical protein
VVDSSKGAADDAAGCRMVGPPSSLVVEDQEEPRVAGWSFLCLGLHVGSPTELSRIAVPPRRARPTIQAAGVAAAQPQFTTVLSALIAGV